MSVITELFENFDHLPVEFRRHLFLIRELDEQAAKLASERDNLKKEVMKKNVLDDEDVRARILERLQNVYSKIDCLCDEKSELTEKLFYMQENFIRKLDQQIEKTEEDKNVQEKCIQDAYEEGDVVGQLNKMGLKANKRDHQKIRGNAGGLGNISGMGGQSTYGNSFGSQGGFGKNDGGVGLSQSFGASLESQTGGGLVGTSSIRSRQKNDPFKYDQSFGAGGLSTTGLGPNIQKGTKRERNRDKKIGGVFESNHQSFSMNSKRGQMASSNYVPFSQDESLAEGMDREEEDDSICAICNLGGINENWICCDNCQKWFHYSCAGVNQENLPKEDEQWFCTPCRQKTYGNNKLQRGYSEFGGLNILEDE